MNLLFLLIAPLLTAVAILLTKNRQQVKWLSLIGSVIQLVLAFVLFFAYKNERAIDATTQMLFEQSYNLFPSWHISFHLGVDGISIAMILLTAFVVIAGVLVSWNIEKMTKEFYFLLILPVAIQYITQGRQDECVYQPGIKCKPEILFYFQGQQRQFGGPHTFSIAPFYFQCIITRQNITVNYFSIGARIVPGLIVPI